MARCVQQMSNIREWTPLDARLVSALRLSWSVQLRSTIVRRHGWHSVDLALAFRSGVRALAMSESHGVGDRLRGVLWSTSRLQIWGSGVRISSGKTANLCCLVLATRDDGCEGSLVADYSDLVVVDFDL